MRACAAPTTRSKRPEHTKSCRVRHPAAFCIFWRGTPGPRFSKGPFMMNGGQQETLRLIPVEGRDLQAQAVQKSIICKLIVSRPVLFPSDTSVEHDFRKVNPSFETRAKFPQENTKCLIGGAAPHEDNLQDMSVFPVRSGFGEGRWAFFRLPPKEKTPAEAVSSAGIRLVLLRLDKLVRADAAQRALVVRRERALVHIAADRADPLLRRSLLDGRVGNDDAAQHGGEHLIGQRV